MTITFIGPLIAVWIAFGVFVLGYAVVAAVHKERAAFDPSDFDLPGEPGDGDLPTTAPEPADRTPRPETPRAA